MSQPQPFDSHEQLLAETRQQLDELQQEHALLLKQQATLLHCLSHDLRTPAMTILGFTDLLIADLNPSNEPNTSRQYLDHIHNSANRQITMINALLQLSSVCHQPLAPAGVNLTQLAQEYLQSRPDQAALAGTRFELHPTPDTQADLTLMRLALAALLDNAIKFTRKVTAPMIQFGVRMENSALVFFIQDNGAGFNPERQDRLYKPFGRVHAPKEFEGLGMGLVTAQTIMQRHAGRLWATSQPDQGATFHFTLGQVTG